MVREGGVLGSGVVMEDVVGGGRVGVVELASVLCGVGTATQATRRQSAEPLEKSETNDSRFGSLFGSKWTSSNSLALVKEIFASVDAGKSRLRIVHAPDTCQPLLITSATGQMGMTLSDAISSQVEE